MTSTAELSSDVLPDFVGKFTLPSDSAFSVQLAREVMHDYSICLRLEIL